MRNPFTGAGQVVSGTRLVGREPLVTQLVRLLSTTDGNHFITGEHRIGKSSVVEEVRLRLSRADVPLRVHYLDVSTLPDGIGMFRELYRLVIEEAALSGGDGSLDHTSSRAGSAGFEDAYEAYRSFRGALERWREGGVARRLVVAFDEFDYIRNLDGGADAVRRLRELASRPGAFGFSCVFVTRRRLATLEEQLTNVSTLAGVCVGHYVCPLGDDGVEAVLDRAATAVPLDEEARHRVRDCAGGHPWLAELLLYHWCESGSFEAALGQWSPVAYEHYERLRVMLSEDDLFDQLLQLAVGPQWDVQLGSAAQLELYGTLRRAAAPDGPRWVGWSPHFQAYLEHRARAAPPWELWRATESTLRDHIGAILGAAHGPEWFERRVSAAIADGARARREKECGAFPNAASIRLLDYTYPHELWQIMAVEWARFRDRMGHDKQYWNERFTLLSKVRTPDAHARSVVVPPHERSAAQAYCQELLHVLGGGV